MKAWRHGPLKFRPANPGSVYQPVAGPGLVPGTRGGSIARMRQWSDLAIARTTPGLLGLFSLVVLWMSDLVAARRIVRNATAWCQITSLTFSDAIAAVRREIWNHQALSIFRADREVIDVPAQVWSRMEAAAEVKLSISHFEPLSLTA